MTKVRDIIELFEQWVPTGYAESWDNVGLQIGNLNNQVTKVMTTLDVTEQIADEAIEKKADFILAHHPLLFQGVKQIEENDFKGKVIHKLIKHDISVYAAHTNLDIVNGGVNDLLADLLQIKNRELLVPSFTEKLYKFAAYVPQTHTESFIEAIGQAGAGHIGNYSHCTFRTAGTGAFKPLEGTNPYIGEQGKLEQVEEDRVETIVKEIQLNHIIETAKKAHPYEEMAYDILPMKNSGEVLGLGRIGEIEEERNLADYAEHVKKVFQLPFVRFVGDPYKVVRRVAVLGGSGKGYIEDAIRHGADVYITGDLTFHEALDAKEQGIGLIDPGHHIEQVMKVGVKEFFENNISKLPNKIEVISSEISTEPFQWK
ncbi:dinuclear metal center protein, YbgI/SA1388 family [Gracilibacillus ureilyticus]|uniref:GTP cyclohydrolase 1 type 2 homolog n=1 Tax=Gracilibacillus ureilyticus TaxID=531814 RepID=A0A1H9M1C1_9BACI|nr:Nif3-like dinuclear metal center hexameric protein [Gracilibacillus ureilyticus]SER17478.1 dinuclear metal center protein, YbgI/SA1388 family [Gracilibacillus ureilyticus]